MESGLRLSFSADGKKMRAFDYQFSPLLHDDEKRTISMQVRKGNEQAEEYLFDNFVVNFQLLGLNEIYLSTITTYSDNCLWY